MRYRNAVTSLVALVLWASAADAAWLINKGQLSPEDAVCMVSQSAIRLEEDLRDFDHLRSKYEVLAQENAKLASQVEALGQSDSKNREALIRADEREKMWEKATAPLVAALEANSKVMTHTIEFTKAQQKEIDSLRSERKWFMLFGGLAGIVITLGAMFAL